MEIFIVLLLTTLGMGAYVHKDKEGDREHEYRMYSLCVEQAKSDEAKANCKK